MLPHSQNDGPLLDCRLDLQSRGWKGYVFMSAFISWIFLSFWSADSAVRSIWRMRSLVSPIDSPISSRVCSFPLSISPNRRSITSRSRSPRVLSIFSTSSLSDRRATSSGGAVASRSGNMSPNSLSPSSPTGDSRDISSCPFLSTSVTLSTVICARSAISSIVGFRLYSCASSRDALRTRFSASTI